MSDGTTTLTADPILLAINDVKKEVRGVRGEMNKMNRELGGVQSTLISIEKTNEKRDTEIESIRKTQADCPARTGQNRTDARLKVLEQEEREPPTGSVDIVAQRLAALEKDLEDGEKSKVKFLDAVKKVWPLIFVAVIGGAAAGGYGLAMILMK